MADYQDSSLRNYELNACSVAMKAVFHILQATPAFRKVQPMVLLRTLHGRVRYPLCGGCRCRPMQPMESRQLAPKGLRCNGTGGLYGGDVGMLCGHGIASDTFRLLCRKPDGLVTFIGPLMRTHAYANARI